MNIRKLLTFASPASVGSKPPWAPEFAPNHLLLPEATRSQEPGISSSRPNVGATTAQDGLEFLQEVFSGFAFSAQTGLSSSYRGLTSILLCTLEDD